MDDPHVPHHHSLFEDQGLQVGSFGGWNAGGGSARDGSNGKLTDHTSETGAGRPTVTQVNSRPAWLEALYAVVVGVGMFVITVKVLPGIIAGVIVMGVLGSLTFAAERRFGHRREPSTPGSAENKDFLRSLVFLGVALVAGWYIFDQSSSWDIGQRMGSCAVFAAVAFVFFVGDDMYQKRRFLAESGVSSKRT